jgi:hypothetical protein
MRMEEELGIMGLKKGWFAILQGLIVASGLTKEEAEKAAQKIAPREEMDWIYLFHLNK